MKTRTYLDHLQLSIDTDRKTQSCIEETKTEPFNLEILESGIDESYSSRVVNHDQLFSCDRTLMVKRNCDARFEAKVSKFRQSFEIDSVYLKDKQCVKIVNHDEHINLKVNRFDNGSINLDMEEKIEIICEEILELRVKNSFSQDLDFSSGDISKTSFFNSTLRSQEFNLPRTLDAFENSML